MTGWHPSGGPATGVTFAHASERLLAGLFDFYGVSWEYEPVEFALEWDHEGHPTMAFRPDFWLPDHRCFVELTTAAQPLVTKKNRKVRRFRALYPAVRLMVVYRADFYQLVVRHGLAAA